MSKRKTPLVNNEIYHVFNRGINKQPIFINRREYKRGLQAIHYYSFKNTPIKLSKLVGKEIKSQLEILAKNDRMVNIIAYCLMPNHYHLLLKQLSNNGISKFIGDFQNSYAKYFNKKSGRDGSLFLKPFKSVHVSEDEQLLHLSRYIHLNPYSSYVVKDIKELLNYEWSSLREYLEETKGICDKELIASLIKDKKDYKNFVLNRADYQRRLKDIEYLTFE